MSEREVLLERLRSLAKVMPPEPQVELILFGAGALILRVLPNAISQDGDLLPSLYDRVEEALRKTDFYRTEEKKRSGGFYFEINDVFQRNSPRHWRARAERRELPNGHVLVVPDPLDIVVSKIPAYRDKDVRHIQAVFEALGRPPKETMLERFREAVEMYRPVYADEWFPGTPGDPWGGTKQFFERFYGEKIDVRKEIVIPGIEKYVKPYLPETGPKTVSPPRPDKTPPQKNRSSDLLGGMV